MIYIWITCLIQLETGTETNDGFTTFYFCCDYSYLRNNCYCDYLYPLQSSLNMIQYLYIIDYWVPIPQSEDGGVLNVIAKDDDECFRLLSNPDEDFYQE